MAFGFARKMDKKPIRLSKKRIFFFFCDETIPDSAFCQPPSTTPTHDIRPGSRQYRSKTVAARGLVNGRGPAARLGGIARSA
jgi:hypothetical protein